MIELRTGVPGSGKTLSMVEKLASLFKRWGQHPEELRPVFQLGIPDLAFPVSPVPLKSVQVQKAGAPMLVPDWDSMPDGSLVLIDEAQGVFPPRSSASQSPEHVAWLNTHRHHGFDIWLTTQHPKLIDGTVRALVGRHMHYRRLFGGMRAVVYEWDACSDSLSGFKNAVTSYWPYPKKVFQWYKSAEIHTKQTFKLPAWVGIPVLAVVMMIFFVPRAASVISGEAFSKKAAERQAANMSGSAPGAQLDNFQTASGVPAAGSVSGFADVSQAVEKGREQVQRKVSELKLAWNVYTDTPDEPAHFSEMELQKQSVSVAVLDYHQRQGRYTYLEPVEVEDIPLSPAADSSRPFAQFDSYEDHAF